VKVHVILTFALDVKEWLDLRSGSFIWREQFRDILWFGNWVDSTAGMKMATWIKHKLPCRKSNTHTISLTILMDLLPVNRIMNKFKIIYICMPKFSFMNLFIKE
jgi:hypothetical protein